MVPGGVGRIPAPGEHQLRRRRGGGIDQAGLRRDHVSALREVGDGARDVGVGLDVLVLRGDVLPVLDRVRGFSCTIIIAVSGGVFPAKM